MTNAQVSDGSQPPTTFDLALSESAGSRSLHRLVRLGSLRIALQRSRSLLSITKQGIWPV
jgi:hypothetical protein